MKYQGRHLPQGKNKNESKPKHNFGAALKSVLGALIVAAACAVLASTFLFSVLHIQGGSMEPTLHEDELVIVLRTERFQPGDVIAFYYNNKILLKRAIGSAGDWVDIDQAGSVSVNGENLYEPYVQTPSLGNGDVTLPFQVPDGRWFVLGDHRETSIDSRYSAVGTVSREQVEGKVVFRIWPLSKFGAI